MLLPRKTDNFETLKLRFSKSLKDLSLGQFLGSSNSRRYHGILKLLVATLKSEVWKQNCLWLFYYFHFERNYDVLKPKSPYILLNKNINVNKIETEWKMKNPTHTFRETNLVPQLTQELQIKMRTVMSWSFLRGQKRGHFLYRWFCPKEIFLTFLFYLNI